MGGVAVGRHEGAVAPAGLDDSRSFKLSVGPRDNVIKDTVRNLEAIPEFVVHMVDHKSREKMNICAIDVPDSTPKTIIVMLGGINGSITALIATRAAP